jgi:hypothetical protein
MTTFPLLSKIHSLVSIQGSRGTRAINSRANFEHEQRKEFRRGSNERLFLQVVQSEDQDMVGTTISCTALNVSPSGLMVACDQRIPEGCFIDLWVDDSARPGKFFLSSEVRWAFESEPGEFRIGVALLEGAATDIEEWRARQAS